MGDSLLRQRPPKFGLMTLTSPSLSTQAEMMPLTGGMGEPGVFMRSANAVEGAASATAAKTTKDRKELVSIFSPSLRELRPCWQGLARRVNDTSGHASGPGGYALVSWCRVWLRVAKSGKLCVRRTKFSRVRNLTAMQAQRPSR